MKSGKLSLKKMGMCMCRVNEMKLMEKEGKKMKEEREEHSTLDRFSSSLSTLVSLSFAIACTEEFCFITK